MVKRFLFAVYALAVVAGAVGLCFAITNDRAGTAVSPGPLSRSHAALEASCTACHAPYERLRGVACVRCHALSDRLLAEQRTRFHAFVPSCVECHVEHEGRERRPTVMDHDALARLLAERSPANAGKPLDCAECHVVEDPHGLTLGDDCAACHVTATWHVPGYVHPSPRSRECVRCHAPPPSHLMMHFEMSQHWAGIAAAVEQCFACHQTSAWNEVLDRGWIDHH